jgi:enolase
MKIIDVKSLQVLDSRGNPTVQVDVFLEDGSFGSFRVPSGASTGIHEAHELRDKNENVYHGKSVEKAVENVLKIKEGLIGLDFTQKTFDEKLISIDGSGNKEVLGANAILGLSIAFAKASAKYYNLPTFEYIYRITNDINLKNKKIMDLPEIHPFANVINGGLHAGNKLNIQEFMLIPTFGSLQDKVRAISEIYHTLKEIIKKEYGRSNTSVGDEGGFAPEIEKAEDALNLLVRAIKEADYDGKVMLAMDAAASDFYDKESNMYETEEGNEIDYKGLTDFYNNLIEKFPIISIEDPMAEDDFEGFEFFKKNIKELTFNNPLNNSKQVLVVGDDLLVTNPDRVKMAQEKDLCNSLLLKINQIGTLTESIEAHKLAQSANWHTIVSHRSGETTDDFIADLAVALESSIKLGAPARGERVAKYNRLLNIYFMEE